VARSQKSKQSSKGATAGSPGRAGLDKPTMAADPGDRTRRIYLILTAFLAGAAVMIIELAGNRVLAPWFGNSLYTWTGLIGVILVSLSGGYYLGGYLADRRPSYSVLAHLLTASAVLTILVPSFQSGVDESLRELDVISGPVVATLLLFALPGCLLAAVSPFAIRMVSLLSNDCRVGVSAGSVGMSATLGSVVGTFATGFFLVPHLRLQTIFVATGLALGVLAVVGYLLFAASFRRKKSLGVMLLGLFGVIGAAAYFGEKPRRPEIVAEEQTFYHRIRVIEAPLPDRDDSIRVLFLDNTREGSQFVKSREVSEDYQRYWELARLFCPQVKRAAFLGGGAYTMPEALLDAYPQATADVVEIDPAVIEIAREYFRVDDYPRMNAVADDARRFLQSTDARYDLIYGDAYRGVGCIPAHLVTVEFFRLAKSRLADGGVFIVNVAGGIDGPRARLFHSVAKTLSEVFSHQCVFATDPEHTQASQNVFIVAADHDLGPQIRAGEQQARAESLKRILATYLPPDRYDLSDGVVFSDDYNPVEYLVAQSLAAEAR
jgi:spermidine synthase